METRLRLVITNGGLPQPRVQWPVQDEQRRTVVWLDLAYPEFGIGIEYEGEEHTAPERVLRDISRYTRLVDRVIARIWPRLAARHQPVHEAGGSRVADLPVHEARGVPGAGADRGRARPGPATAERTRPR